MRAPIGLLALAFLAGFIDSVVGGGGLIQIPGLILFFPGVPVPALLGTSKVAGLAGTSVAAAQYARRVPIPWKALLPAAPAAVAFSWLGARTVSRVDPSLLRPLLLVLLVAMAIFTVTRRDFGAVHSPRLAGRRQLGFMIVTAALLGFYDGFFGPGTGSLLLFLFVAGFGFDFLVAAASARVLNMATNAAAVGYFALTRQVLYDVALPMAACNIAGSMTGARLAMGRGRPLIRALFLLVLAALIIRMALDMGRH